MLHLVPPLISFLTHNGMVASDALDSVKFVTCGAAPAGEVLIKEFYKKFSHDIAFQEGKLPEKYCML